MKRILLLATLLVATTSVAQAQHRHHHHHHGGGYSGWALGAGVLGGLAAGALLAQPPRPYYAEPMYMAPPPTPVRCYRRLEGYDIYGTPLYRRICEPVY